jgi:hypothetical protein
MLLRKHCLRLLSRVAFKPSRANLSFRPTRFPLNYRQQDEPEYMVVEDPEMDVSKLKIPYLDDQVQQEMYALYMSDPVKWDVPAVAMHYKASLFRTKAIIFLMHRRYKMMKEKGLVVKVVQVGDKKPSIVFEIPEPNKTILEKFKADRTQEPAALIEAYNASQTDEISKAKMTPEELKQIFADLDEHEGRWQNVLDYHAHQKSVVDDLVEEGANPNFQESTEDAAAAFAESYKPKLLRDEEVEAEKARLIKQIAAETKAKVDPVIEQYIEKFGSPSKVSVDTSTTATTAAGNQHPQRWKFAFRDLGKIEEVRKSGGSAAVAKVFGKDGQPVPTTIRTRTGRLRKANPLEEMDLSWHPKPTFLDRAFNEEFEHLRTKLLDPFKNPDGDDHLTNELIAKKAQRVEQLKAQKSSN